MKIDWKENCHREMLALFRQQVFAPLEEAFKEYGLKFYWDGDYPSRNLADNNVLGCYYQDGVILIKQPKIGTANNKDCWIDGPLMVTVHETAHGVFQHNKPKSKGFKNLYIEAEARLAEVVAYQKMGILIDPEGFWYDYQKWMQDYLDTCTSEGNRKMFLPRHDAVHTIVDTIIAALPEKLRRPTCETFCPHWLDCNKPRRLVVPCRDLEQKSLFSGALLGGLKEIMNEERQYASIEGGESTAAKTGVSQRSMVEISHQLLWRQSELLFALSAPKGASYTGYRCLRKGTRFLYSYLEWREATAGLPIKLANGNLCLEKRTPADGYSKERCEEHLRRQHEECYEEMLEALHHCFFALVASLGKEGQAVNNKLLPLGLLLEKEIPDMLEGIARLLRLIQAEAISFLMHSELDILKAKTRLSGDMKTLSKRLLEAEKAGPYWRENQMAITPAWYHQSATSGTDLPLKMVPT